MVLRQTLAVTLALGAQWPAASLQATAAGCQEPLWGRGRIVFVTSRTGDSEVYRVNDDGTGRTNLTRNRAEDIWPTISPDGSQVAFVSDRSGYWRLYTMDLDGGDVEDLCSVVGIDPAVPPTGLDWDPTTGEVVVALRMSPSVRIYRVRRGCTFEPLTPEADLGSDLPRFSSDGSILAMRRARAFNGNTSEIYLLTLATGVMTRLTHDAAGGMHRGRSEEPELVTVNGKDAAIFSRSFGRNRRQIYRKWLDGGETSNISRNGYAEVSPTGTANVDGYILFVSNRGPQGVSSIWRMDTDGNNAVQLTREGGGMLDWWAPSQ